MSIYTLNDPRAERPIAVTLYDLVHGEIKLDISDYFAIAGLHPGESIYVPEFNVTITRTQ